MQLKMIMMMVMVKIMYDDAELDEDDGKDMITAVVTKDAGVTVCARSPNPKPSVPVCMHG